MLGFGRNDVKRAKAKAWAEDVERGRRIKRAQEAEARRRKAEAKAEREERQRKAEIERLRKRTELIRAQAAEREAVIRRRRAKQEAGIGRYFMPPRKAKIPKAVTRKRGRKAKIGWF